MRNLRSSNKPTIQAQSMWLKVAHQFYQAMHIEITSRNFGQKQETGI